MRAKNVSDFLKPKSDEEIDNSLLQLNQGQKNTELIIASVKGNIDIVKILIKNGADINAASPTKETALMYAAMRGNKDVVEILIKNGADINIKDTHGNTALIYAARNITRNNDDIVELLIKSGADVPDFNKVQKNWKKSTKYIELNNLFKKHYGNLPNNL